MAFVANAPPGGQLCFMAARAARLVFARRPWHRDAMQWSFWKMHGAGNDFILLDDRALAFPATDRAFIAQLCDRRRGIGSDGLLLIQPATGADFRMRFFNPDGGEADLCGNGARCVARLAHELGIAPAAMHMKSPAGIIRAEILSPLVRIHLPPPKDWRINLSVEWNGAAWPLHFVNTGVPHAVLPVADLAAVDIPQLGAFIRRHELFAPAGTNVNFIRVLDSHRLAIRTYERGVEAAKHMRELLAGNPDRQTLEATPHAICSSAMCAPSRDAWIWVNSRRSVSGVASATICTEPSSRFSTPPVTPSGVASLRTV